MKSMPPLLGLALTLAAAAGASWAVRPTTAPLAPRDVEFANLVRNVNLGRGFVLDIRSQYASLTTELGEDGVPLGQVSHYGGYDYAVLPVFLTALAARAVPGAAGPTAGLILWGAALALVYRTLQRRIGTDTALAAGLLLALNPLLANAAHSPEGAVVLAAVAAVWWASCAERSGILTGLACLGAFLAHPALLALALPAAVRAGRIAPYGERARTLALFAVALAFGPLWLGMFNRSMGAPAATLPGAWTLRVLEPHHGRQVTRTADGAPAVAESPAALWRRDGRAAVRRIGERVAHRARDLAAPGALGAILALLLPALVSMRQTPSLGSTGWVAVAMAALLLALDGAAWSADGPTLLLPAAAMLLIAVVVIGTFEFLGREPLRHRPTARRSAAAYLFGGVAIWWAALDVAAATQARRPAPDPPARAAWIAYWAVQPDFHARGIIASDDPWNAHLASGLPTTLVPWDIEPDAWGHFLSAMDAEWVVLNPDAWPPAYQANLQALIDQLDGGDWDPQRVAPPPLRAWRRP